MEALGSPPGASNPLQEGIMVTKLIRVVFDDVPHTFDNQHGKGYTTERAVCHVLWGEKGKLVPRHIITTKERGIQAQRKGAM